MDFSLAFRGSLLGPRGSFSLSLSLSWLGLIEFSAEQSVNSRGKFSRRTTSFLPPLVHRACLPFVVLNREIARPLHPRLRLSMPDTPEVDFMAAERARIRRDGLEAEKGSEIGAKKELQNKN